MNKLTKDISNVLDFKVLNTSLCVLIKAIFIGAVFYEIASFSLIYAQSLSKYISSANYEVYSLIAVVFYLVFIAAYIYIRGFLADAKRIIKSKRTDIVVALSFGFWINFIWGGFLSEWYTKEVSSLNYLQLLTIIVFPFVLGCLILGKSIYFRKERAESALIPDIEIKDEEDDLLNSREKADNFAERVFNNSSPESFVFGVDAPWGIGKSSFINLCEKYWSEHHKGNILVYKFSPLRYVGDANLVDVFIDELINTIQKDSFVPEIRPLISQYARLLKEVSRFSLFGLNMPSFSVNYSVDDAFDDLNMVLRHFDKKIVIIVDDLDRINFSEIESVLFAIRKSFALPNISYVLCYDTENIGIMESKNYEIDKVSEFLEKFINIKISLFLDKKDLEKYVSENLDKALLNSTTDPILIRQAMGGLLDIYKSSEYHKYLPFIGDVRKLKRLINMIIILELPSTDFKNSDFDKRDLIHLLLIYIHYPNIFRKIYDTEMNGGHGFFSVTNDFADNHFGNSEEYNSYLKQFPENGHQQFLLNQIFNLSYRIKENRVGSISEDLMATLACFNGGFYCGRNLEAYLDLIVNLSKPEDIQQHSFFKNWKDKIFDGSMTIDDVLEKEKFSYNQSEQVREKLWRIIINNARKLNDAVSANLIGNLLENIHNYSLLDIKNIGIGLRDDISIFLVRLLDAAGWGDYSGDHSHNTEENIKGIAEWIFGEGQYSGRGILSRLSNPEHGILGLYDLLAFRLHCSTDRGGDIFDLSRSLSKHSDKNAPTEGNTRDIAKEEMREISQKVFGIFKEQYIDPGKNIFEEIEKLHLNELAGKYSEYVESQIKEGIILREEVERKIASLKSGIISFIVYQLGNELINSGVGCGFYDPSGKEDKHQIKEEFNRYLFNFCFNPAKTEDGYEHFVRFLLRNYASVFASQRRDGREYIPSIGEFIKALDKEMLTSYWQENSEAIKGLGFEQEEKQIINSNYTATYKEHLDNLYEVLDELVPKKEITMIIN
ncbi:MAG: P-loop NTPase fold protein [Patescibacteria group bacterium]